MHSSLQLTSLQLSSSPSPAPSPNLLLLLWFFPSYDGNTLTPWSSSLKTRGALFLVSQVKSWPKHFLNQFPLLLSLVQVTVSCSYACNHLLTFFMPLVGSPPTCPPQVARVTALWYKSEHGLPSEAPKTPLPTSASLSLPLTFQQHQTFLGACPEDP